MGTEQNTPASAFAEWKYEHYTTYSKLRKVGLEINTK